MKIIKEAIEAKDIEAVATPAEKDSYDQTAENKKVYDKTMKELEKSADGIKPDKEEEPFDLKLAESNINVNLRQIREWFVPKQKLTRRLEQYYHRGLHNLTRDQILEWVGRHEAVANKFINDFTLVEDVESDEEVILESLEQYKPSKEVKSIFEEIEKADAVLDLESLVESMNPGKYSNKDVDKLLKEDADWVLETLSLRASQYDDYMDEAFISRDYINSMRLTEEDEEEIDDFEFDDEELVADDFAHDLYDAVSNLAYQYRDAELTKEDFEQAWEIFIRRFFEEASEEEIGEEEPIEDAGEIEVEVPEDKIEYESLEENIRVHNIKEQDEKSREEMKRLARQILKNAGLEDDDEDDIDEACHKSVEEEFDEEGPDDISDELAYLANDEEEAIDGYRQSLDFFDEIALDDDKKQEVKDRLEEIISDEEEHIEELQELSQSIVGHEIPEEPEEVAEIEAPIEQEDEGDFELEQSLAEKYVKNPGRGNNECTDEECEGSDEDLEEDLDVDSLFSSIAEGVKASKE